MAALLLNQLPEEIRSRVNLAIANGTGFAELGTRISTGETELVLVPADGTKPLWLTRMAQVRTDGEKMESPKALFAEPKPDMGALATQLFKLPETILRKPGNFLPHAKILTIDGEIIQVGDASPRHSKRAQSITRRVPSRP